jgi:oxygen-independent coproporphyrinogen-3 oxidase
MERLLKSGHRKAEMTPVRTAETMARRRLALYINFPFCIKKCAYCDFVSFAGSVIPPEEYSAGVIREMELRSDLLDGPVAAETLYLGGGTPSLLPPKLVARLITTARERYALALDAEVTLEANPGTVTPETLAGYCEAGVNRLSLGVQSFDDRMLALLGRVHTAAEARNAVGAARVAGFDNIGLDLMHSLPGQSTREWEETLALALELRPDHISAYGLTVEEGTPLCRLWDEGYLSLPDDETGALMYRMTADVLTAVGYEQYEIANFALPGRRSRHNQVYWRREPYLGFGAAAHSLLGKPAFGRRWHNSHDPADYLRTLATGKLPEEDVVMLTRREAMSETFFLGLRTTDGVDTARFRETFGATVEEVYGPEIEQLLGDGLLERNGNRLFIPAPWLVLSNQVLVNFV